MSNEEHLKLLEPTRGQIFYAVRAVKAWNEWREREPSTVPDLEGAELKGSNLVGSKEIGRGSEPLGINFANAKLGNADFSPRPGMGFFRTDLSAAILRDADLTRANLRAAILTGADLRRACLAGAVLSGAHLRDSDMRGASLVGAEFGAETDLTGAILVGADLSKTTLAGRNFSSAQLSDVRFRGTDLRGVNFRAAYLDGADLREARLRGADLREANLAGADLRGADLSETLLIGANFESANLIGCRVYGCSTWNVKLSDHTKQSGLIITEEGECAVTVDALEVAQFIHLLLNRHELRNIIDTITSRSVLILGRFTNQRKTLLYALAEEIRTHNLVPIIFDFERPVARDLTETIQILAGMSLFVIADISNPRSSPMELQATIPDYRVPFVPIIQEGEEPFAMFGDLNKYDWLLSPVLTYTSPQSLCRAFKKAILDRAWKKRKDIQIKNARRVKLRSIDDYLKDA
jgi:uncharacterized protein YjbI with pentapeptide repeats